MESKKVHLYFEKEFPSMKCGECGVEYVLIGVHRSIEESDNSERISFWEQQANCVYCPYCGRKGG